MSFVLLNFLISICDKSEIFKKSCGGRAFGAYKNSLSTEDVLY